MILRALDYGDIGQHGGEFGLDAPCRLVTISMQRSNVSSAPPHRPPCEALKPEPQYG